VKVAVLFQAQVMEQTFEVNMEGSFVHMPRRLDFCFGGGGGSAERRASCSDVIPLEKNT